MQCRHQLKATELDCLYSPSHWSKLPQDTVMDHHTKTVQQCYEQLKTRIPVKFDIPYGELGKQKVDVWGDEDRSNQIIVLFHGGYWIAEDRKDMTTPVKPLVDNGYVVACVGYEYAIGTPLSNCVEQAAKALKFLQNRWPAKKLCAGGFCAGAHLAFSGYTFVAVIVCPVTALRHLPRDHHYTKLILVSTICQLSELPKTYIGRDINLTFEEAKKMSIRKVENFSGSVLVLYASMDTPQFIKQNEELIQMFRNSNINVISKMIVDEDHFSLNHSFVNPNSVATKVTLDFLKCE